MKIPVFNVLINPDNFYRTVINEKESLKIPCLIVLTGAIIGGIYAFMVGGLTGKLMGDLMPGLSTIIQISTLIGALIATFVVWVVMTAVFFGLSCLFKGQGSFRRCLEMTGYGYLPQVIGSVVTLIAAYVYVPKIIVPEVSAATLQDPQQIQEVVKALMQQPNMVELTQITAVISIVFLLWSANSWIFGMRYARGLSMRNAAICVGVPVIIYVLYVAYSITGV
jgi:hypothetical protein